MTRFGMCIVLRSKATLSVNFMRVHTRAKCATACVRQSCVDDVLYRCLSNRRLAQLLPRATLDAQNLDWQVQGQGHRCSAKSLICSFGGPKRETHGQAAQHSSGEVRRRAGLARWRQRLGLERGRLEQRARTLVGIWAMPTCGYV